MLAADQDTKSSGEIQQIKRFRLGTARFSRGSPLQMFSIGD